MGATQGMVVDGPTEWPWLAPALADALARRRQSAGSSAARRAQQPYLLTRHVTFPQPGHTRPRPATPRLCAVTPVRHDGQVGRGVAKVKVGISKGPVSPFISRCDDRRRLIDIHASPRPPDTAGQQQRHHAGSRGQDVKGTA